LVPALARASHPASWVLKSDGEVNLRPGRNWVLPVPGGPREVVADLEVDRLVHHADVVASKATPTRLKDRDLGRVPAATTEEP